MPVLQLRPEFQTQHMRATAIELSNRQNTGWTQGKAATELLDITYPTGDVRRALDAVSATSAGKPIVMMGQRGSGKSHIMALVHHAFGAPDQVESWAVSWGEKLQAPKLTGLKLQRGFMPLSETLSNQEYPCPFRKYDPAWIRVVRQNHHIIRIDVCDPAWARNVRR
jgi:hypothetical protein